MLADISVDETDMLNTDHLHNTLRALESAVAHYHRAVAEQEATDQEIFRMAIVKGFESKDSGSLLQTC